MSLNAEERMRQAEYEQNRNPYARLTVEQVDLMNVTHERDRLQVQIDTIREHLALYDSHERSAGITLDAIRAVIQ